MDMSKLYENLTTSKTHNKKYIYDLLASRDIEILGLIYSLFENEDFIKRIYPSISQEEYTEIFINHFVLYLFECIKSNPNGDYSDSSYSAARDLSNWVKYFFYDVKDMEAVYKIILLLKSEYLSGSEEMRICLECGAIEHIFEEKDIQTYFSQWKSDPVLSIAYKHAKDWADSQLNKE